MNRSTLSQLLVLSAALTATSGCLESVLSFPAPDAGPACTAGGACALEGNACRTGALACDGGVAVCVAQGTVANGTPCGDAGVCNAGACTACAAGEACAPAAECRAGAVACGTGAPVCADVGASPVGTPCDGGVCNASAACVACVTGEACQPGECRAGAVACGSGAPVCTDSGASPAGTMCDGGVCDSSGSCLPCVQGATCRPTECTQGTLSCGAAGATCGSVGNLDAGTACTGGVCVSGACVACTVDAGCTDNADPECHTGRTTCDAAGRTCVDDAARAAGTTCTPSGGGAGVCSPSATCVACTPGAACTTNPGGPCLQGVMDCSSGTPTCVDDVAAPEATACTGGQCLHGACVPSVTVSGVINLSTTAVTAGRTCAEAPSFSVTALTATSATLSGAPAAGCLAAGDLALLISLQGTPSATANVGLWEVLTVQQVTGNTVTFTAAKANHYGSVAGSDADIGTGPGHQKVMLQRVPVFGALTVAGSGSLTTEAWTGLKGGVVALRAATVSVAGAITASARGFRDGAWSTDDQSCSDNVTTEAGESYTGPPVQQTAPNGGAPGGIGALSGVSFWGNLPLPASAGHATAGAPGVNPVGRTLGGPGAAYGVTTGSRLFLGSGTAGQLNCSTGTFAPFLGPRSQGAGGVVVVWAKSLTVSGGLGASSGSGGASGGTVLLRGDTIVLGTSLVQATGATQSIPNPTPLSNTGAAGRIVVDYVTSLTGTTVPAATTTQEPGLTLP